MPSVDADLPETQTAADIAAFIRSHDFPCVGAKSALALDQIDIFESGNFWSPARYREVRQRLACLGARVQAPGGPHPLRSFLWAFRPGGALDEAAFEKKMWQHLQCLHDLDAAEGLPWARGVSSDPSSPKFSMSVAGHAFFVVGLHPGASRDARRFSRPMLAFNAHVQFEQLRADGRYDLMRDIIRARDRDAHGDINPMLGHHGDRAQAPQFSGRNVSADWQCPLKVKTD
jgi:uncharacterized protein